MKLKLIEWPKELVWKYYEVISLFSHVDWSICLDFNSLTTCNWRFASFATVLWSDGKKISYSIKRFDLSPLYKNMSKLDTLMNKDYFSEEKLKEIKEVAVEAKKSIDYLKTNIRMQEKRMEELKEHYKKIEEWLENENVQNVESWLLYIKKDLWI